MTSGCYGNITAVFQSDRAQTAWYATIRRLYQYNADVRAAVVNPDAAARTAVSSISDSLYQQLALTVHAVDTLWKARLRALPMYDLQPPTNMLWCAPAGVRVAGRRYTTCRRYHVCPACRLRLILDMDRELEALPKSYTCIVRTDITTSLLPEGRRDANAIVRGMRRRGDIRQGACVTLPVFDADGVCRLRTTVIDLTPNPVDVSNKAGNITQTVIDAKSPSAIIRCVAEAAAYPQQLLSPKHGKCLAYLIPMTSQLRRRTYHNQHLQKGTTYVWNNNCGRLSPAPTDLAIPTGDNRRQLLQLSSDYRLHTGEAATAATPG